MSSRLVALLAVAAVVCMVGSMALAADKPKEAPKDVLRGTVVSVDATGGSLVVKPKTGDNVTVATDKDTTVKVDKKGATLAEVKIGMMVEVQPATGTAKTVNAQTPQAKGLSGTVVSVDATAGTLIVKPKKGDNVTVTTDKDTTVKVDKKGATLADVKIDMMVEVQPATGTAKTVNAHTVAPKAAK